MENTQTVYVVVWWPGYCNNYGPNTAPALVFTDKAQADAFVQRTSAMGRALDPLYANDTSGPNLCVQEIAVVGSNEDPAVKFAAFLKTHLKR